MELQFLEQSRRELVNGHTKKRHPFRYFTLGTICGNQPKQRTVVLRKLLPDMSLLLYTDLRSQKVADIAQNPAVSALFYHPKQLLQLRIEGKAELITDTATLQQYWNNIPENSRKDYITIKAPGTEITNPEYVDYDPNTNYFTAIRIVPETIEYLQLKRPNHLRVCFRKVEGEWEGQFLTP